jgi:hypothetical protein
LGDEAAAAPTTEISPAEIAADKPIGSSGIFRYFYIDLPTEIEQNTILITIVYDYYCMIKLENTLT